MHEKEFNGQFEGAVTFSRKLPSLYQELARKHDCHFLDTTEITGVSDIDGIHLDLHGHQQLSKNKIN